LDGGLSHKASTYKGQQTQTKCKHTPMPRVELEPKIPVVMQQNTTHTLDDTATIYNIMYSQNFPSDFWVTVWKRIKHLYSILHMVLQPYILFLSSTKKALNRWHGTSRWNHCMLQWYHIFNHHLKRFKKGSHLNIWNWRELHVICCNSVTWKMFGSIYESFWINFIINSKTAVQLYDIHFLASWQ
jgi:hypothetical protein